MCVLLDLGNMLREAPTPRSVKLRLGAVIVAPKLPQVPSQVPSQAARMDEPWTWHEQMLDQVVSPILFK